MRSVASWAGRPLYPGYAASKAVQWSLTYSLRQGLREQGTLTRSQPPALTDIGQPSTRNSLPVTMLPIQMVTTWVQATALGR